MTGEFVIRALAVGAVWVLALFMTWVDFRLDHWWWTPVVLVLIGLALLGTWDLVQTRHSILRAFPIIGHARWIAERIRPEIYQYFIESNTDGAPFDRETRDAVYRRAKGTKGDEPFGTERDVNAIGYEFLRHSLRARIATDLTPRVRLGGPDCARPYDIAVFNISAMSFGSLSGNAIEALNGGAARGGFAHDTGEGAISPYHLKHGGDLIWEIGSGYFGCRTPDGHFDAEKFRDKAVLPSVKAISIKLSQGAKPGLGGVLPGAKVTPEIAATRGVPVGQTVISPPAHSAFRTPLELMHFISTLRSLADGKPIGLKLCVGARTEFLSICKAMLQTGVTPDFVIVDGSEGGTGAAPPGVRRLRRHAADRGADAGAELPGRHRPARSHQDRRLGQDHQRLRHCQTGHPGRRLHPLGAGDDVRRRLHSGDEMPHQPLPDRGGHPGPRPGPRTARARQDRPGGQLPAGRGGQRRADGRLDGPGRLRRTEPVDAEPPRRLRPQPDLRRDLRVADARRAAGVPAGELAAERLAYSAES
jgi:hypothetical protein